MEYILIQKKDFKSLELKKELNKLGITLIPISGTPVKMPIYIALYYIKIGKPEAVIFRYLNDYSSFTKTLFRLISEVLSIIISKLLRTKLIWICHNVDKETDENYPLLTKYRRYLFTRFANKILVTDPLLIKYARKEFPRYSKKVGSITFGPYSVKNSSDNSEELIERLENFVGNSSSKAYNVKYGFVAGSINWKTAQYDEIPILMDKALEVGIEIRMIIIGPIGNFLKKNNKDLYLEFKNNDNILFLDGFYNLDMKIISNLIDFYWRVYLDLSIPATLYEAAFYKKPILTQNKGFLGEAVYEYSLGYVVQDNYTNLREIMDDMSSWNSEGTINFLQTHSWRYGAENIFEVISK